MIYSMTGFGRGEKKDKITTYLVELRSVNHRYLDLKLHVPREVSMFDPVVRKKLSNVFSRGSFDISIWREHVSEEGSRRLSLNLSLAKGYYKMLQEISKKLKLEASPSAETIARFSDVVTLSRERIDEAQERDLLEQALDRAIKNLTDMRKAEGAGLANDILKRLSDLEKLNSIVEKDSGDFTLRYRDRLMARLKQMNLVVEVDQERIAQEVALQADRADISEEISRIKIHIGQYKNFLKKGGAVGRQLDFLTQELHREANTISSKINSSDIASVLVEMKSVIDKIREQVQNIE